FLALVALSAAQPRAAAILFIIVALAFLANAALGVYHAGVEWHFWAGPAACSGSQALTTNAGNMLEAMQQTNVVRCDEPAWRLAGISFAGWNVVASLLIVLLSIRATSEALQSR